MPRETRWFIKTSLVCLVLASALGTLYFGWGAVLADSPPPWLRNLHVHLATVGWLVNMVLGVALWMFPMPVGMYGSGKPRYPRSTVIACFVAVNAGLALRFAAEPLGDARLGLACGLLQTSGILLGVGALWPRIRAVLPPPSAAREGGSAA